jgi:EAL domain-containing protein (putative c-di-GMP-specific phosphodiesterase class I)
MTGTWYLEGIGADGSHLTHELTALPIRVGRDADNDLVVAARGLSRRHAELGEDVSGQLRLTDLDSTNGTFINRERVAGSALVSENDVIHFGNAEFRLGLHREGTPSSFDNSETTMIVPSGRSLSEHFVPLERQFREFLAGRGMSCAIQPIVDAHTGALVAHELLGRCKHPELSPSPIRLFNLAAQLKLEAELSAAFRVHGVRAAVAQPTVSTLFVNTHPLETFEDSFLGSIQALINEASASRPGFKLVLEVHETAVMEVARMRELAAKLHDMNISFAYDDFGAGQARLNEIGEVPAEYVKFDMGLIRDIHIASDRKQKVVRDLVTLVKGLGSVVLAEGVEVEAEAVVCRQMGFELIQGYLTGRPVQLP